MLKKERQQLILNSINQQGKVLSKDLVTSLCVSEDTIRRDLNELSEEGLITKVHGGALSNTTPKYVYDEKKVSSLEEKKIIAQKAVKILNNGQVIIISGGTTNYELARAIPDNIQLTVYTYSLPVAMTLSDKPNIEVIFIGGKLFKSAQVTIGIDVIHAMKNIHADICFIGTPAIDIETGLTEIDYEVAHVKKAMIEASDKVVSLCIHNKLNTTKSFKVCPIEDIDLIVTSLLDGKTEANYEQFLVAGCKMM